MLLISRPHLGQGTLLATQPLVGSALRCLCCANVADTMYVMWQKAEMEKTKTKKANADRGSEKKTMKDKVLEKEFKLVSFPDLTLHRGDMDCVQQAQEWTQLDFAAVAAMLRVPERNGLASCCTVPWHCTAAQVSPIKPDTPALIHFLK